MNAEAGSCRVGVVTKGVIETMVICEKRPPTKKGGYLDGGFNCMRNHASIVQ